MGDTWETIKSSGRILFAELGEKTGMAVDTGKLRLRLMEAKQNRNRQCAALGDRTAQLLSDGLSVSEDADVSIFCDRIKNYDREIADLEAQLEALRAQK